MPADQKCNRLNSAILPGLKPARKFFGGELPAAFIQGNQTIPSVQMPGQFFSFGLHQIRAAKLFSFREIPRFSHAAGDHVADSFQVI
jgi:hypothetical protein